jgi:hypothetical protein
MTLSETVGNRFANLVRQQLGKPGLATSVESFKEKAESVKKESGGDLAAAALRFLSQFPGSPLECYLLFGTIGDDFADQVVAHDLEITSGSAMNEQRRQEILISIEKWQADRTQKNADAEQGLG